MKKLLIIVALIAGLAAVADSVTVEELRARREARHAARDAFKQAEKDRHFREMAESLARSQAQIEADQRARFIRRFGRPPVSADTYGLLADLDRFRTENARLKAEGASRKAEVDRLKAENASLRAEIRRLRAAVAPAE